MHFALIFTVAVISAYLIGAIPIGLVVVRLVADRDIRTVGSGRTGGTNALRAAGPVAGVLTGLGDLAKGVAAVNIARLLLPNASGLPILEAVCAIAAVAGHNWPVYLRFRGGAGTGPNVGAAIALWPLVAVITIPLVPILLVVTGYASVTSTLVALTLVLVFLIRALVLGKPIAYVAYAVATSILVGIALLPNYRRLIDGTERVIGPRAKVTAQSSSE